MQSFSCRKVNKGEKKLLLKIDPAHLISNAGCLIFQGSLTYSKNIKETDRDKMKLKFNLSFWYSLTLIQTLSQNPYKSMGKRLTVFSQVLWYKCMFFGKGKTHRRTIFTHIGIFHSTNFCRIFDCFWQINWGLIYQQLFLTKHKVIHFWNLQKTFPCNTLIVTKQLLHECFSLDFSQRRRFGNLIIISCSTTSTSESVTIVLLKLPLQDIKNYTKIKQMRDQNIKRSLMIQHRIVALVIHQLFSLSHDWSKRVT